MRRAIDSISFHFVMVTLAAAGVLLLVAPTLVVLILSFTSGMSLKFPPPGFSLQWYAKLADAWQLQEAAANSLKVAALATLASVLLCVPAALILGGRGKLPRGLKALDVLFSAPLVLPAMALGLAMLVFFTKIGLPVSLLTLVIGHTVACSPFILRTTVASVSQLNPSLLEGSASLGAGRWRTFRRISLPLIAPGVLSGAFMAFMFSFDNVGVSLFLRSARIELLPIRLWLDLETRLDVTVAAASGLLIAFTVVVLVALECVRGIPRRRERRPTAH